MPPQTRSHSLDEIALMRQLLGPGPMRFACDVPQPHNVTRRLKSLSTEQKQCFTTLTKQCFTTPNAQQPLTTSSSHSITAPFSLSSSSSSSSELKELLILRFAAAHNYNAEAAWNTITNSKLDWKELILKLKTLTVETMEPQLLSKCVFPIPGLKTMDKKSDVLYMRPSRYDPNDTPTDKIIDHLIYCIHDLLDKDYSNVDHGICFIANMNGWMLDHFNMNYCNEVMQTLQGLKTPVNVNLFLIVDPPIWFNMVWKVVKTMLSADLKKKAKIVSASELHKFLAPGYELFLPTGEDLRTPQQQKNNDNNDSDDESDEEKDSGRTENEEDDETMSAESMVRDWLVYRTYKETGNTPLLEDSNNITNQPECKFKDRLNPNSHCFALKASNINKAKEKVLLRVPGRRRAGRRMRIKDRTNSQSGGSGDNDDEDDSGGYYEDSGDDSGDGGGGRTSGRPGGRKANYSSGEESDVWSAAAGDGGDQQQQQQKPKMVCNGDVCFLAPAAAAAPATSPEKETPKMVCNGDVCMLVQPPQPTARKQEKATTAAEQQKPKMVCNGDVCMLVPPPTLSSKAKHSQKSATHAKLDIGAMESGYDEDDMSHNLPSSAPVVRVAL